MSDKKQIMYESDDSAVYESKTLTGWWTKKSSHTGGARFWGEDEHMARYDGSTHSLCECGEIRSNSYTLCEKCRAKKKKERWLALPSGEWDGKDPVCTFDDDKYFYSIEEMEEYCEECDCSEEDLMLVFCEGRKPSLIDDDYWCDDLADDQELPSEIYEAVAELNEFLKAQPVLSWWPGKKRAVVRQTARY